MRGITVIIAVCVLFTAIVAVPFPQQLSKGIPNGIHNQVKATENQVQNVIQLRHLSTLHTRDYFADIIRLTLGMSVKELLAMVEITFKDLDRVTKQGVAELNAIMRIAPEIRQQLTAIINTAINQIFETIGVLLKELGNVLPALPSNFSPHSSASDIIYALLGRSLEELVIQIANALEKSLHLLNSSIVKLIDLAAKAKPEIAKALDHVSDEYLNEGKAIVIPMLDKLLQLVDTTTLKATTKGTNKSQHKDLLNGIISTLLGTNIETVTLEADNALTQLIPLVLATRDELHEALKTAESGTAERAEVQTKVIDIYDKAIDDAIRDVKPIFTAFLQFEEKSRREKNFVYDLTASLLGIGVDTFKNYAQNVSLRIDKTLKFASAKIIRTSAKAGFSSVLKVWKILDTNLASAKSISKPLLDALKHIVEHKRVEEFSKVSRKEDEAWSENDGTTYNRDAIIKAACHLLGFEVVEATNTLKTSLENLDELMESGLLELESVLSYANADLRTDILGIMNETLTNIHITLQPMLDVLLPFLPDEIRPNKDVALDIYVASNGVNVDSFLSYCSSAARKIPRITELAIIRIKTRAARAGPTVHGRIAELLMTTDYQTKAIIKPFLDIVGPIISPRH